MTGQDLFDWLDGKPHPDARLFAVVRVRDGRVAEREVLANETWSDVAHELVLSLCDEDGNLIEHSCSSEWR